MTNCYNCTTEKTPMWRRTMDNETNNVVTLCNACGLYYKTKGYHRPTVLISKKNSLSTNELLDKLITESSSSSSSSNKDEKIIVKNIQLKDLNIIHCANCQNINTSIWRKDDQGRNICNACGLYFKKKGYHRTVKKLPNEDLVDKDVLLEIDDNLIRFNRIKRRKRSSTSNQRPSISKSRSNSIIASATATPSPKSKSETITDYQHTSSNSPSASVTSTSNSPLTPPQSLIPATVTSNQNYTINNTDQNKYQRSQSTGSIDQYHFDYTQKYQKPVTDTVNFNYQLSHNFNINRHYNNSTISSTRFNLQPERNVKLPPISSILNI